MRFEMVNREYWMPTLRIALVGLAAAPLMAEAPVVQTLEIVDRAIEFHGGEVYSRSLSELTMCSKSGCYDLRSRIDDGLFELEAAGPVSAGYRRAVVDNDTTALWLDQKQVDLDERLVTSVRNWVMARHYFVYLPYRLNDGSVLKQDLGRETWGQRSLHKVKVTFVPGSSSGADDEFLFWFDPETGRLEQFAYSFVGNPGGLRLRRIYNHRRVGGILFYDQENWGVDGPDLSVDQIRPEGITDWDLISRVTVDNIRVTALDNEAK